MLILVKKLTYIPDGSVEDMATRVYKAIRAGYDVTIEVGKDRAKVMKRVDELFAENVDAE